MRMVDGGVTAPRGFFASGVHCGMKLNRLDLALLSSARPAVAAGVFTTNKAKAAPVLVSQERMRQRHATAIVTNSGNANALTGEGGMNDAREMCRLTGAALGIDPDEVLVCSTGIIGKRLPMQKITAGISAAARKLSPQGHRDLATAILTTDKQIKEAAVQLDISGRGKRCVRIGGVAKGSGMIAPNLATMLCFLTTDACITEDALDEALRQAVNVSFNQISVDGDMSTNDTVLALANGLCGNKLLKTWRKKPTLRVNSDAYAQFCSGLQEVCIHLAKAIVRDGEGATRLLEVQVHGAAFPQDARRIARSVASSSLVKTALAGACPNWGRIVAAIGAAHTKAKMERIDVSVGGLPVVQGGNGLDVSPAELRPRLAEEEVLIYIDLHQGACATTFWGCDLTEKYVKINKRYL